jgi:hypothetical protein
VVWVILEKRDTRVVRETWVHLEVLVHEGVEEKLGHLDRQEKKVLQE